MIKPPDSYLYQQLIINYSYNNMSTSQQSMHTNRPVRSNVDTGVGSNKKNTPASSKSRTPYCGVCFKAKQPASIYKSHWTRVTPNPRSPITCPLILQTLCKYCKNKGHSAKYCPVAAKKDKRHCRLRASSVSSLAPSLSDISEREMTSPTEIAPSPTEITSSPPIMDHARSWLQVAMNHSEPTPVEEAIPEPVEEAIPETTTLCLGPPMIDDIADVFPSPPQLRRSRPRRTWNWNDDTDSDDE